MTSSNKHPANVRLNNGRAEADYVAVAAMAALKLITHAVMASLKLTMASLKLTMASLKLTMPGS
eukprot:10066027-Karenia_brevis.AAC.1